MARRIGRRRRTNTRLFPTSKRIEGILGGGDRDPVAHALRLLTPLGVPPYRLANGVRQSLYTAGVLPARDLGRPTISVGNLTVGGTGKTPMVIEVARRLRDAGRQPAVLLRGYEPAGLESKQGSDEAAELRGSLGGDIPVMANSSRVTGAAEVLEQRPDVDTFVLDDGFQHRRAKRDLDLVLLDASRPFGFGHCLPRGLMREPPKALRRADAVVVTRCNRATPEQLAELDARVEQLTGRPPVAHCRHRWAELRCGIEHRPVEKLAEKTVLGCAGLANPTDFEATLRAVAGRCVGVLTFPDHYRYSRHELGGVFNTAAERGADAVVITEKDWVKWRRYAGGVKSRVPVYRPVVQMAFVDGEAEFAALLREAAP
ncbi:MAG: tetraacyldisaccharide 4'-kinase [Planctomycetota bacterium]